MRYILILSFDVRLRPLITVTLRVNRGIGIAHLESHISPSITNHLNGDNAVDSFGIISNHNVNIIIRFSSGCTA